MGENIFIEYSRFIEKIKEEILSLQSVLIIDGELTSEQYAFLQEYAAIDERGIISNYLVKEKYLKKRDILQKIFESVRVHNYFNSLDDYTKKEELVRLVAKAFNAKVKEQKDDDVAKKLEEQKNEFVQKIYNSDKENFFYLIDLFFGTDVYYYKWYNKKDMASELESGFIYDEHQKTSTALNDNVIQYEGVIQEYNYLLEQKSVLIKNLSGFTKAVISFCFRKNDETGILHNVWAFLRGKKNNKETLYSIFDDLSMVNGSLIFYRKLSGTHSIINILYCFNKYLEETYGKNVTYVEVEDFVKTLTSAIVTCYQEEIAKIDEILLQKQIDIGVKGEALVQNVNIVKKGATLQKDIYLAQKDEFDYRINGLTDEEEKRVFEDMKEYLVLNRNEILNMEEGFESPLLKKKR